MPDVLDTLRSQAGEIARRFPAIRVVYAFGSQVRGRVRADSDVDVAISADVAADRLLDLRFADFLERRLGKPVDVAVIERISPFLQHEAIRARCCVYERSARDRHACEARSFREYQDAVFYQRRRLIPHGVPHG